MTTIPTEPFQAIVPWSRELSVIERPERVPHLFCDAGQVVAR